VEALLRLAHVLYSARPERDRSFCTPWNSRTARVNTAGDGNGPGLAVLALGKDLPHVLRAAPATPLPVFSLDKRGGPRQRTLVETVDGMVRSVGCITSRLGLGAANGRATACTPGRGKEKRKILLDRRWWGKGRVFCSVSRNDEESDRERIVDHFDLAAGTVHRRHHCFWDLGLAERTGRFWALRGARSAGIRASGPAEGSGAMSRRLWRGG